MRAMIPLWLSRMPFSCSEKYASHPCTVSRVTGSSLFSVGHSYACLSTAGDQVFGPYFLVGWSFTVDPSESRRLRINRRRLKANQRKVDSGKYVSHGLVGKSSGFHEMLR